MIPTIQFVVNVMLIRLCKINSNGKSDENSFLVEEFLSLFLIIKGKHGHFFTIYSLLLKILHNRGRLMVKRFLFTIIHSRR
jgi:hypothetical protein